MKTPSSSKGITCPWLEYVLGTHLDKSPSTLKVVDYTVGPATGPGDGFNSELVRVTAEVAQCEEGQSPNPQHTTSFSMVAKFLSLDPMNREMNRKMQTDEREYLIYNELMKNLNTLLVSKVPEEPKVALPQLIYGKFSAKEFILILENIKIKGYDTNDKHKGLEAPHLLAAVDNIAKVHALSFVYNMVHDIKKEYPCIAATTKYVTAFSPILNAMLLGVISFLRASKETEALGQKIAGARTALIQKCLNFFTGESPISCLVHGDYWNNNLMYKHKASENGTSCEIEDVMLIDWGVCSFGSPLFDLQYLIYTSTTRQVRQAHLDEVLRHYHSTFVRLVTLLDAPPGNWNYDQFKAKWDESRPVGFVYGCALTQGTLSTANPINMKPEPSVLDKPFLAPIKVLVNGMKSGLAKVMVPLTFSSTGRSMMEGMFKQIMKPIVDELKSGKNQVMNTRLLDMINEADEEGLFIVPNTPSG